MDFPNELKFTKSHEWAKLEDDVITLGITEYASTSLGDIVFVELPKVGDTLDRDTNFGVIESVKAVSDLVSPVSGEVIEVNEALSNSPELLNQDPYIEGWLIKIKPADVKELENLMDNEAYTKVVEDLT